MYTIFNNSLATRYVSICSVLRTGTVTEIPKVHLSLSSWEFIEPLGMHYLDWVWLVCDLCHDWVIQIDDHETVTTTWRSLNCKLDSSCIAVLDIDSRIRITWISARNRKTERKNSRYLSTRRSMRATQTKMQWSTPTTRRSFQWAVQTSISSAVRCSGYPPWWQWWSSSSSWSCDKITGVPTMDLSTTPRRATESLGDLQKTRVAKSVFSIRSLVDVEEAEVPVQEGERSPSKSLDFRSTLEFRTECVLKRVALKTIARG